MNGVINVLKPPGMTSHDVVAFLRRQFNQKKIGHTGTLDPQAAGVLPVCIGQATRLANFLSIEDKEYLCRMTLGIATITQDAWGEVISKNNPSHLKLQDILSVLKIYRGEITQVIPMYSAVKIDGEPLYKKARRGETEKHITRKVLIKNIDLIKFEPPHLTIIVTCSKGTYIRTLCKDIGETLGVGGCMSFLLRTRVGRFCLSESYTIEDITEKKDKVVLPMGYCIQSLPKISLGQDQLARISHGQKINLMARERGEVQEYQTIRKMGEKDIIAVMDEKGELSAIGQVIRDNGNLLIKPKIVFKNGVVL